MSQLNVDTIKNRLGTAGPTVLSLTVTNDAVVGGALTVTGDLTVNGTETIINTTSLEVEDKNIGIASVSSPTDLTADGGGITIYGDTDKTWTWERDTGCFEYNQPSKFRGVVETVAVGSTYDLGAGNVVLELDVRNATTYTHSLSNGSVGIVSFKNMPADTGVSNGTTITVIFTQNSAGTANTTAATGIGTNITVIGFEDGATVAGISTRALVGSATTVTLSTTASDRDFVSFFVHSSCIILVVQIHLGCSGPPPSASYQVYATEEWWVPSRYCRSLILWHLFLLGWPGVWNRWASWGLVPVVFYRLLVVLDFLFLGYQHLMEHQGLLLADTLLVAEEDLQDLVEELYATGGSGGGGRIKRLSFCKCSIWNY
jgi:hypothetical protein